MPRVSLWRRVHRPSAGYTNHYQREEAARREAEELALALAASEAESQGRPATAIVPADSQPSARRLLEGMQCTICMDTFDDPHSLPCTHTFCHECIKHWLRQASEIHCPLCKLPFFRRQIMRNHTVAGIVEAARSGLDST